MSCECLRVFFPARNLNLSGRYASLSGRVTMVSRDSVFRIVPFDALVLAKGKCRRKPQNMGDLHSRSKGMIQDVTNPGSARSRPYRTRPTREVRGALARICSNPCEKRGFPRTEWIGQDAVFTTRSGADLGVVSCLCRSFCESILTKFPVASR